MSLRPLRRVVVAAVAAAAVLGGGAGGAAAQELPAAAPSGSVDGWPLYRLTDAAPSLPLASPDAPWRAVVELAVDGRLRRFSVLVPAGLPAQAPVVLGLHGLYATRSSTEAAMRLLREAPVRGFVAVYPSGTSASWNAGRCCGRAAAEGVDDVALLQRVVAEVAAVHPVDPRRVYAVGWSNGGMLAYRVACAAPGFLAAIAVVAGGYLTADSCRPTVPTPTMVVHGRRDTVVPWAGARSSASLGTRLPSVAQSVAVMRRVNDPAGVRTLLVDLPRQGHAWPTATSPGRYDAAGHALTFLLRARR